MHADPRFQVLKQERILWPEKGTTGKPAQNLSPSTLSSGQGQCTASSGHREQSFTCASANCSWVVHFQCRACKKGTCLYRTGLGVWAAFLFKPFLLDPFSHLESSRERVPTAPAGTQKYRQQAGHLPAENGVKQERLGTAIQGARHQGPSITHRSTLEAESSYSEKSQDLYAWERFSLQVKLSKWST